MALMDFSGAEIEKWIEAFRQTPEGYTPVEPDGFPITKQIARVKVAALVNETDQDVQNYFRSVVQAFKSPIPLVRISEELTKVLSAYWMFPVPYIISEITRLPLSNQKVGVNYVSEMINNFLTKLYDVETIPPALVEIAFTAAIESLYVLPVAPNKEKAVKLYGVPNKWHTLKR